MYVIKRSDQKKGYVAVEGSKHSYTRTLTNAQVFSERIHAERNCCDNEYVLAVSSILRGNIK